MNLLTACQRCLKILFECQMVFHFPTLRFLPLFFLYISCLLVLSTSLECSQALSLQYEYAALFLFDLPPLMCQFLCGLPTCQTIFTLQNFLWIFNKWCRSQYIWWIFQELITLKYHKHCCSCVNILRTNIYLQISLLKPVR